MTVIKDVIEGSSGRATAQGWEIRRIFKVTGLTGDAWARMVDAASDPDVPSIGDPHPNVPNARLREIIPNAEASTDIVELTLVYREESEAQSYDPYNATVEVGSAVSQETTNKDYEGNIVTVSYNNDTQPVEFPRMVPQTTIVARRQENFSPLQNSISYVGKVNSGGWTADPGAAARTWLCTRITGTSTDGGDTYTVTYEFAHKDTWDTTVYYISAITGGMPSDVVAGTGIKTVQIYDEIDFGGLNL